MPATKSKVNPTELQSTTRILLTLWELGGVGSEVKRGDLTKRIVQKGQKSTDYKNFLDKLAEDGAIAVTKNTISLSAKGVELLSQNLKNADFTFASQVGAKTANALLKWIREMGASSASTNGKVHADSKVVEGAIGSYDAFKSQVIELFKELDKGYNYSGLVPIWHLRQEVGNRVKRTDFNDWMMQMQSDQIFYLQTGDAAGATAEQKQDSIESEIRGLLFYASEPA